MPSKTVWVGGGLVLAISAVAYLSYNEAPAGKDAAGTIVEAKRAIADSTNNPTPTPGTTDNSAGTAGVGSDADRSAADRGGADRGGADRGGADRGGADRGANRGGADASSQ